MTINKKRNILKKLYPEDIYQYSSKLTLGEEIGRASRRERV